MSFCAFVAYAESRGCVEADTSALIVFTRWQTMLWTVCVVADVDTQRRNLLPVLDLLNWYQDLPVQTNDGILRFPGDLRLENDYLGRMVNDINCSGINIK